MSWIIKHIESRLYIDIRDGKLTLVELPKDAATWSTRKLAYNYLKANFGKNALTEYTVVWKNDE